MNKLFTRIKRSREEKKKQDNYVPLKRKLSNLWFITKLNFKFTPFYVAFSYIYSVIDSAFDVITSVYFLKWLVDLLSKNAPFSEIIKMAAFVGIIFITEITLNRILYNVLSPRAQVKQNYKLHQMLFKKATTIELEKYDDSDFYNKFIFSLTNSYDICDKVLWGTQRILGNICTMIFTGAFIVTINPSMIGFVVVSIILSTTVLKIRNKVNYKYSLELNQYANKKGYIERVFSIPDFAKEMKITRVNELLLKKYDKVVDDMTNCVDKYGPKMAFLSCANSLATDIIFRIGLLIFLCVKSLIQHVLSYGDIVGSYNAINNFQGSINNLMQIVPDLDLKSMEIDNFRKFNEYVPKKFTPKDPFPVKNELATLEIKNLTYTYTSSTKPVLSNINLTINKGEKVAIVGYNGAGKSTLIKLILRLYDPDSGEVIYNGNNVKRYNVREYRDLFGVTFQDYQVYATDVKSNVLMGIVSDSDIPNVENSLRKSGVYDKIISLDKGLDTSLTREYDDNGVNLSGGESQKLAISRVFAHSNQVVILDEPSAALDPIAEYEFNKTTLKACEGKSVIFISHRLSTTIEADRIIMLEKGQIVEQGSHEELMKLNGKYAEMFNKQAESYVEGVKAVEETA